MAHVPNVTSAQAYKFPFYGGDKYFIVASGEVPTSGWSNVRLSPRFYVTPPADGMWDIDFIADEPNGMVLQVVVPVTADTYVAAPDWLKGFRIHAEGNTLEIDSPISKNPEKTVPPKNKRYVVAEGQIIFRDKIAHYEDSWQPIGFCGPFSLRNKKLVHELYLTVEGPDEARIRSCFQEAVGVGLIAAIVAAYGTGGAALPAAVSAFLSYLTSCLGESYSARVDDVSHWEEWCT